MSASLLLSFLVWMLVMTEAKIDAGFMVPLVFENIPNSVVLDGAPTGSVYVQVRGSKQAVANLLPQQIRAHVDLSQSKPGDEFVQINHQDILLPSAVTVLGIYPPYLDLKFLAKKAVPVHVLTSGKPAEGYVVTNIAAIPRRIEIVGPLPRVTSMEEVDTFPVDISGRKSKLKVKAELTQPGDDMRLLQLIPTEVVIDFEERVIKRKIKGVPVKKGAGEVEFSPLHVTVEVEGNYGLIMGLAPEQLEVLVAWEADEEASVRPLAIGPLPGVAVLSVKPPKVKIK